MDAPDALSVLATDLQARGYESMAVSVRGAAAIIASGDPVEIAGVGDEWARVLSRDGILLRMLPTDDPYAAECAFVAASMQRVISEAEASLIEINRSVAG